MSKKKATSSPRGHQQKDQEPTRDRRGRIHKGGMPAGHVTAKTLDKALVREVTAKFIQAHMPRMLTAQIEAACGVAHLMLRNDDGTWQKAPEKITADEIVAILNGDPNRYFIASKDPNTSAFTILAAYALDRPKEQPQQLDIKDPDGRIARLMGARKRVGDG